MNGRRRGPRWLLAAGVSIAIVATALWTAVGIDGLAIAAVSAVVWVLAPTAYAVAVGGLCFALVASGSATDAAAAMAFGSLFAADFLVDWPPRAAAAAIATLVGLTGLLASVWVLDSLALAAFLVAVGFAVVAYTIHRYELVRLDIIEGADA